MLRKTITREQKTELAREAMRAAMDVRFQLGLGLEQPICVYSICERLGVPVRFVDVSMEGIYRRNPSPRIVLSAHRPLARRHFNCAHELGHHVFGHGATLDELQEDRETNDDGSPEEFQVNSFAGHLLMPVLGIRQAFSRRRISPSTAAPHDILAVACEFGVGYDSLATQLTFSLTELTPTRRLELLRARAVLRRSMLPKHMTGEIALLDGHFSVPTLDVEVSTLVIAPVGAKPSNDVMAAAGHTIFGGLFRAVKQGTVELFLPNTSWAVSIRVARKNFVGLARFRYLEDD